MATSKKGGTGKTAKTPKKAARTTARTTARRAAPAGKKRTLEAALASLPADAAETMPDMPVAIALQEANDVATAARKHAARLRRLPFDHALLDELPLRVRWLRDAESDWRSVRVKRLSKALAKARQEAEELKRELIDACRYLLRNDAEAQATIDLIVEGTGLADLIEDLHALVRFCHARARELAAADVPGGLEKALDRATELAELLADSASSERSDTTAASALARRNQCFALVSTAVREVRAAARYLLRKDPAALTPFRNQYHNQVARRSRGKKAATSPAVAGGQPA